jgi:protein associated with RNAse G/E
MAKFTKSYEDLKLHVDEPEVFWRLGAEFLEHTKDQHYPQSFISIEKRNHPAIIQDFISSPLAKEYYVREELYHKIKNL